MPYYRDKSFERGRWHREIAALPLPGPALVMDVRQRNDLRLMWYLATEVEDLAREMRLNQIYQWRLLDQYIRFLKLDILGLEPTPTPSSSFVIRIDNDDNWPLAGKNELAEHIGKHYINPVRNSRIIAMNDYDGDFVDTDFETASPEQSKVRVFFLVDLNEAESFERATTYAKWLKDWCSDDAGPTRTGRNERIETVGICMNAAPHRHHHLFENTDSSEDTDSSMALDTIILLQTYRDDDGYIDEEAQVYQAELLLYTLLLYWPESLERMIEDPYSIHILRKDKGAEETATDQENPKILLRPTYIVGISALEYSARWGTRWLDYGLAAKIIEILRDSREVQREKTTMQAEVAIWWEDWWQRVQAAVSSFTPAVTTLQALDLMQAMTSPSNFRYNSPDALLQSLSYYRQRVSQLYTGTGGITLQLALDSAPLVPSHIKQGYEQSSRREGDDVPLNDLYHLLSDLQMQAQLFLLPLFKTAHGALPRAIDQITALNNKIRRLLQHPPDLQQYHMEFERQVEEAQKNLKHLLQKYRKSLPKQVPETIHHELDAVIQIVQEHLKNVREAIAANIALTLLQWSDLYDPSGQASPYQQRLKSLDKDLKAAQEQAIHQQKIADERLKFSLSETRTAASHAQTWRNLNNRKDVLKWHVITESFLQSYDKLASDPTMELLSEMLLRRLGSQTLQVNGHHHRNGHYTGASLQQEKNEGYFQAISTALLTALLAARTGHVEITDILPLLNRYAQMKPLYLTEPSVLDSDVLGVEDSVKEAMLKQALYGRESTGFPKQELLPAEFVLSAWVASQHTTNLALVEALDSRNMVKYMEEHKSSSSEILKELRRQNKLVGYPDERVGDDYYYLLLPPDQESEAFLNALDFAQVAQVHAVRFPDKEKILYLHIHRIRQL